MNGKYNLTWQLYTDHLREMLHEMMKSNELTDVTLVCDDKTKFKAHKIVLSACSSVFKSIINDLPTNSSVIYLRGIQHQELETILQFMYLGVATCSQERMNEFLNVAKNLELKEISKEVKSDDGNLATEIFDKGTKIVHEQQTKTDAGRKESFDLNIKSIIDSQFDKNTTREFECDQCESKYTHPSNLRRHILSKHEGIKYDCNQCDQKYSDSSSLSHHVKSKHKGEICACDQCEFVSTKNHHLRDHIQSIHEGVKYTCDQCNHKFNFNRSLNNHKRSKH